MRNPNRKHRPKHTNKGVYRFYARFINIYNEPVMLYEFRSEPTKTKCEVVSDPNGEIMILLHKNNKYKIK